MTAFRRTTALAACFLSPLALLSACADRDPAARPRTTPRAGSVMSTPGSAHSSDDAAGRVVHDARSVVDALAVIPGHPERRIAEWHTCLDRSCEHRWYALVVTGNGFRDAHVVSLLPRHSSWYLEPAGSTHFAVALNGGRRQLVDLRGHVTPLRVGESVGPLTGAEVPLRSSKSGFLGVDPATGAAHRLSTPKGVVELLRTPAGQLRALSFAAFSWSDDRGATWHVRRLHLDGNELPALVATPSDAVQAVLMGGDGATLFPWIAVLRGSGATWTSYPGPHQPTAYVDSTVVLPDGRLLTNVDGWSDQRAGRPPARPFGFYTGGDWSHLSPVGMGAPFAGEVFREPPVVVDTVVTKESVTTYALEPDGSGVVASTDAGVHWHSVRAR